MTTAPTRRIVLVGLLLPAAPRPVTAQAGRDAGAVAARITERAIVPGYRGLAAAAHGQAEAWAAFGRSPTPAAVAPLRDAFQAAADAWSAIEAVRAGPIAEDQRYERMAHWPERRNAVGRALAGLSEGGEAITPERLRRASVAGQGLTALERILYGEAEDGAEEAAGALVADARRRALGVAIAAGLHKIAAATLAGWTEAGGGAARGQAAGPDGGREALTRLVTDQLALLDAIVEAKLGAPLGKGLDAARPLLAEAWRSGRSLRAVRINLDAAAAFARAALSDAEDELRSVEAGLATARSLARELADGPLSLGALAGDPSERSRLILLRDAVASAREVCGPAFAEGLGVTIGFNSRDGD